MSIRPLQNLLEVGMEVRSFPLHP